MAVMGTIATTVAATGDAAHYVATSRLVWMDFGNFLEIIGLVEVRDRLSLLNWEPAISYLLQAPLVVMLGLFTLLSILLSAQRSGV